MSFPIILKCCLSKSKHNTPTNPKKRKKITEKIGFQKTTVRVHVEFHNENKSEGRYSARFGGGWRVGSK